VTAFKADNEIVAELDKSSLNKEQKALRLKLHQTIEKITVEYGDRQGFNTCVAAVMELMNSITKFISDCKNGTDKETQDAAVINEALQATVLLLSPITPHIAHSLWRDLGNESDVTEAQWPAVDKSALEKDSVLYVIQVNGKVRSRIEVAAGADKDTVLNAAKADENVIKFLEGNTIRKEIVIPNKLVNIVAN
jgi:leucyl-tRNA synthetase